MNAFHKSLKIVTGRLWSFEVAFAIFKLSVIAYSSASRIALFYSKIHKYPSTHLSLGDTPVQIAGIPNVIAGTPAVPVVIATK